MRHTAARSSRRHACRRQAKCSLRNNRAYGLRNINEHGGAVCRKACIILAVYKSSVYYSHNMHNNDSYTDCEPATAFVQRHGEYYWRSGVVITVVTVDDATELLMSILNEFSYHTPFAVIITLVSFMSIFILFDSIIVSVHG